MNGIRPKEILDLLHVLEQDAGGEARPGEGHDLVLATAISLNGSVYTRAGAMGLFVPESAVPGTISAKSMQGGLYEGIEEAAAEGRPVLQRLKINEDDPILGFGFLCSGTLEVFFEPVDDALRAHLRRVRDAVLDAEGIVCALEIEGPEAGRRVIYRADDPAAAGAASKATGHRPSEAAAARACYKEETPELVEDASGSSLRRVFLCPVRPVGKTLIFGSGPDAAFLAARMLELGFAVYVADPRPGRLRNINWDRSRAALLEGGWDVAAGTVRVDEETSVVVMAHNIEEDRAALKGAFASPAGYIGLTGSQKRTREVFAGLEIAGARPRPGTMYSPAGLDIGAETPEELALSVAAEIMAWRSGRTGGRLSHKPRQHSEHAGHRVPGLILAAGMGRRFGEGHKLSAVVHGKPVLRHVVENALSSKLDPVIVVLGAEADAALKVISGIEDPRLRVVFNPSWASGKASSFKVGLREAPQGAAGVVALLGDMPMIPPWLIDRVLSEFELSGKLAFPVFPGPDGPLRGYPTAFPRALFGEIQSLDADETTSEAVRLHWSEALRIPLEDASTQLDIDKPEDLELLSS
ncbi:MAG: NTP transferase domain-containing protein [Elusimicrobiota bacterium]|jgi:xanthine/CO dehydrogenase XdhC/CoxF family maturation factor/molybdopterin-guanine dinucleotide biosynthesis protein A